jgi:alpha-tubulin suppressor-like RCC1 family protein
LYSLSGTGKERLGLGESVEIVMFPSQINIGKHSVASISLSTSHTVGITADGKVFSFGFGAFGKLGHGDELNQLVPIFVSMSILLIFFVLFLI